MGSRAGSIDGFHWRLDSAIEDDALTRYRDAVAGFYDVTVAERGDGRFYNHLEGYRLGGAILTHCRSVAQDFRRSRALAVKDGLDHIQIIIQREGRHFGNYDGRETEAGPGSIRLLDMAQPWISRSEDYAFLDLVVPREALPRSLDRRDTHGLVIADGPGARMLQAHLATLWREAGDLSAEQAAQAVEAGLALLGAAASDAPPPVEPHYHEALERTLLARARAHIRKRLSDPALTPAALAAGLGLSARTLYRLFEPLGGVAATIQAARLDATFVALRSGTEDRRSISEIAFAHGFASNAHFSRAFKERFGVRPSEVRSGEDRSAAAGDAGFGTVASWAQRL